MLQENVPLSSSSAALCEVARQHVVASLSPDDVLGCRCFGRGDVQATTSVVPVSSGYYTGPETDDATLRYAQTVCPVGYYCSVGVRNPCPAGSYGNTTGLSSSSCNGPCAPGYYCAIGSTSSTQFPCGNASVYCPEGSGLPLPVAIGYYSLGGPSSQQQSQQAVCPSGAYCTNGTLVCRALT